jgi:hypothetical protein
LSYLARFLETSGFMEAPTAKPLLEATPGEVLEVSEFSEVPPHRNTEKTAPIPGADPGPLEFSECLGEPTAKTSKTPLKVPETEVLEVS